MAVLKVLSDILLALGSGNLVMLTLLDLSAAFDSVDHRTLLWWLRKSYGLNGKVIDWFTSYLSDRVQHVRTTTSSSTPVAVVYGVPQGSVLGPILFLLYTADLLQLIKRHHLTPYGYADDTQIYSRFPSALTRSQCGWKQTGCSWILPRPKSSGAHKHCVNTLSRPKLCAEATPQCRRSLLSRILVFTSMPTSPWRPMSPTLSERVLQHCVISAACDGLFLYTPSAEAAGAFDFNVSRRWVIPVCRRCPRFATVDTLHGAYVMGDKFL